MKFNFLFFFLIFQNLGMVFLEKIEINDSSLFRIKFNQEILKENVHLIYLDNMIQLILNPVDTYANRVIPICKKKISEIIVTRHPPQTVKVTIQLEKKIKDIQNQFQLHFLKKELLGQFEKFSNFKKNYATFSSEKIGNAHEEIWNPKELMPILEDQKKNHLLAHLDFKNFLAQFGILIFFLIILLSFIKYLKTLNKRPSHFNLLGSFFSKKINSNSQWIQVIASQYLDHKKRIVVIKILDSLLVLSISDGTICLLKEIQFHETQFSEFLEKKNLPNQKESPALNDIRSQIKDRLNTLRS